MLKDQVIFEAAREYFTALKNSTDKEIQEWFAKLDICEYDKAFEDLAHYIENKNLFYHIELQNILMPCTSQKIEKKLTKAIIKDSINNALMGTKNTPGYEISEIFKDKFSSQQYSV